MKASEYIQSFKAWAEKSPFPEIGNYFLGFENTSSYFDDYKELENIIGLRLPENFLVLLREQGRLILDISFIDPIDIFQDFEDTVNGRTFWPIGAPSNNGLIIMTPDEIVNAYEAIQFALGKNHPRGSNWYPIATTRADMEEGWLIEQTFNYENNNNPIAPFYTDSIFRYDNTLEANEKLTMSIDNFDDFIGDYFSRLKHQLLKLNKRELRILIDDQIQNIKKNIKYQ